jgi:hypothetical protein
MNENERELVKLVLQNGRVKHVESLVMLLAAKYGSVVVAEVKAIDLELFPNRGRS